MPESDTTPLEILLALQDEDVRASQLRHRLGHLPEAEELAEIEGRIARLDVELAGAAAGREEIAGRRDAFEAEAAEVGRRIDQIESRAASGQVSSYRDQEAMAAEIESLRRRRRQLEDEELLAMEAIEPVEAEIDRLGRARSEQRSAAEAVRQRLTAASAQVREELTAVLARRDPLAASLAEPVRLEYERLAHRLAGVAVARLVHGMCDGCRLQLPATEIDRIRHAPAGTLFHCDQCGRILVPLGGGGQVNR